MFTDIVFPKENETEFVETAIKLGIKSLIFVYDYKDNKTFEAKKNNLSNIKDVSAEIGILVDDKNINKIQNTDDYVFSRTPSRKLIESKKTYVLHDFEDQMKPDFIHHRNSGLNQVLCKIIKDKEKIIGISFSSVLNSRNPEIIVGRMRQNVKLAKKYGLKTIVASFAKFPNEMRAEHEIQSFKRIIGF